MTIEEEAQKWEEEVRQPSLTERPETKREFKTASGFPVKPLYTPLDLEGTDYLRDTGFPGQTAAIYPTDAYFRPVLPDEQAPLVIICRRRIPA